jgi:hypothetical protein
MFGCDHSELSFATSSDWETVCADCGEVVDMGKRQGRPATERGAYNPNPARQLGRISDEDWSELKEAADAAGQSMVEWALPTLLKKARREFKKSK